MSKKRIYLDYASLTPVDPRVIREMKKYASNSYANPSSLYKEGVAARNALNDGRTRVADFIHAHADEIVFTSGGTEANGLALEGAGRTAYRNGNTKPHVIISAVEHSSIMEVANMLEKHGTEVTRLGVDASGMISLDELKKALKPNTFMVSIMTVNNELGTIQPIREIAKVIRDYRRSRSQTSAQIIPKSDFGNAYPLFHTDAAQGIYQDLNVEKLGIDLMTLDGTKSYGPRGIGCLYIKRGTPIEQTIYGGGQENGMRSGTENIPAIMGFAKSLELIAAENKKGMPDKIAALRGAFIAGLKEIRSDITIRGNEAETSPHILNISIPGIDNEFFVLQMDARGIACSTKSSCLRDEDESYVLKAIGADSKTSVRFSFGLWTKKSDVGKALKAVKEILSK